MRVGMYRYLTQYEDQGYGNVRECTYQVLTVDLMERLDPCGNGTIVGRKQAEDTFTYFYELQVFRYRVNFARVIRDAQKMKEIYELWNS